MPALRYFEVTQTRRVRVSALNAAAASNVAYSAFSGEAILSGGNPEVPTVLTEIEEVNLVVWDERFNNGRND